MHLSTSLKAAAGRRKQHRPFHPHHSTVSRPAVPPRAAMDQATALSTATVAAGGSAMPVTFWI